MGNMTLSQYMLTYGNDKSLPKLDKQVNIAGPFNGVLNMNEKVNEISVDYLRYSLAYLISATICHFHRLTYIVIRSYFP